MTGRQCLTADHLIRYRNKTVMEHTEHFRGANREIELALCFAWRAVTNRDIDAALVPQIDHTKHGTDRICLMGNKDIVLAISLSVSPRFLEKPRTVP